jgi:glycosyltransferase involved in cell wall biosynthesis
VDDILLSMRDLLLNPELRARMERLGAQRAPLFSWEKSAAKTLELYYEIAGKPGEKPVPALNRVSAARR